MKTLLVIGFLLIALLGCKKGIDNLDNQYIAKIVGFDINCSTCILSFPDDSITMRKLLGESLNNYYQAINLNKNDFTIGQMIKVKVRKAVDTELQACITLAASNNYKNIYVSDYSYNSDFAYNETIELAYGKCLNDLEGHGSICFDSVLSDSRCPLNATCVWAGEAVVRFKFTRNNDNPIFVDLRTGTRDTVVNGYKFSFIELLPYPYTGRTIKIEDYKARIIIKK